MTISKSAISRLLLNHSKYVVEGGDVLDYFYNDWSPYIKGNKEFEMEISWPFDNIKIEVKESAILVF